MARDDDPWFFPRADLAARTLALLTVGGAQALTLFAPRRSGKTLFLLRDLGPLAQRRGHAVVYASFWQAPLAPIAVLLHAIDASLGKRPLVERARDALAAVRPRVTVSAAGAAAAEIDLDGLHGGPPTDLLLRLDDQLGRLGSADRPALLMLDEVQEIARDAANAPLVAALRTSLDKRSDTLRAIFTGSSRERLKAMFSAREAPFFHFATPLELPPLGEPFVDHLAAAFTAACGRRLDRAALVDAFARLRASPYLFRRMLEMLALDAGLGIETALARVQDLVADERGFAPTWLGLTPIQRAVARLLAEGVEKPFGIAGRERVGALTSEPAPTAARIQAALRALVREDLVDKPLDVWRLAEPEFAEWILRRDGE